MVDFMTSIPRGNLWASCGIGKTPAVLFMLQMMGIISESYANAPTLVVAPSRVAEDTWKDEAAKWTQFQDLEIVPLVGSPQRRLELLKLDRPIFTISYENAPWLVEQWTSRWPYKQVIADESDRIKGFRMPSDKGPTVESNKRGHSGLRSHALARIAHNLVDVWWNLTGTPVPNGLKDLWGQNWYVDRGARLGHNFSAFKKRWFMPNWGGRGIQPMPFSEVQIHAAMADVALTVDARDYFDLKEPNVISYKIKLPKDARRIYKQLENDMFAQFEAGNNEDVLTAFNAAALTNKCLQLANGAVYTEHPLYREIHHEKLDALESILGQSGGRPLFVAYSFKSDKERILKRFKNAVDISTKEGAARFKSGAAAMGVAHPGSMGHGIDWIHRVTNIMVRFGHDWNQGWRHQMLERIGPMRQYQIGREEPVMIYDIIAEGTIDVDCIASHAEKRSVQDALLAAMKRRG